MFTKGHDCAERKLMRATIKDRSMKDEAEQTFKDRSMKDEAEQTFWHDENLPYIEARSACNSYACYEKHTHPTLSIGVVEEGISKYHHQRFSKTIGSGSIVIINPEEVHSCNPKPNEHWTYKMFNIDPCWLPDIQQEMTEGVEK